MVAMDKHDKTSASIDKVEYSSKGGQGIDADLKKKSNVGGRNIRKQSLEGVNETKCSSRYYQNKKAKVLHSCSDEERLKPVSSEDEEIKLGCRDTLPSRGHESDGNGAVCNKKFRVRSSSDGNGADCNEKFRVRSSSRSSRRRSFSFPCPFKRLHKNVSWEDNDRSMFFHSRIDSQHHQLDQKKFKQ